MARRLIKAKTLTANGLGDGDGEEEGEDLLPGSLL